jgi:hypothetical protein
MSANVRRGSLGPGPADAGESLMEDSLYEEQEAPEAAGNRGSALERTGRSLAEPASRHDGLRGRGGR